MITTFQGWTTCKPFIHLHNYPCNDQSHCRNGWNIIFFIVPMFLLCLRLVIYEICSFSDYHRFLFRMNVGSYIYFQHFYFLSDSYIFPPSGMLGAGGAGAWYAPSVTLCLLFLLPLFLLFLSSFVYPSIFQSWLLKKQ